MAPQSRSNGVEKKRKSKKKKSRTEVSSSSESDSEQEQRQATSSKTVVEKSASPPTEEPVSKPSKKSKKKSKHTEDDQDTVMAETEPVASTKVAKAAPASLESFSDMYLRKITAELADDLDKVREAPDFKANSIPMLVHALRQGESLYSADEKRRIVSAAGH